MSLCLFFKQRETGKGRPALVAPSHFYGLFFFYLPPLLGAPDSAWCPPDGLDAPVPRQLVLERPRARPLWLPPHCPEESRGRAPSSQAFFRSASVRNWVQLGPLWAAMLCWALVSETATGASLTDTPATAPFRPWLHPQWFRGLCTDHCGPLGLRGVKGFVQVRAMGAGAGVWTHFLAPTSESGPIEPSFAKFFMVSDESNKKEVGESMSERLLRTGAGPCWTCLWVTAPMARGADRFCPRCASLEEGHFSIVLSPKG